MFSKKLSNDAFSNLIAHGTQISGAVRFSGILKIQGIVDGDIICQAQEDNTKQEFTVTVDKDGVVNSNEVKCQNAIIGGKVSTQKLWVESTLRVLKTAKIEGALIYYRTLEIEPGAVLHNCQMRNLDFASEGEVV